MCKLFVTVGTQIPFDRLIVAIDRWAELHPDCEIFAQIGDSSYCPARFSYKKFIDIDEYEERATSCDAIVSHAGMGAILTALESAKPILIMPRRASLKEHRNEHQLATAERFAAMGKVMVAMDEQELPARLDELLKKDLRQQPISPHASPELLDAVRKFLFQGD